MKSSILCPTFWLAFALIVLPSFWACGQYTGGQGPYQTGTQGTTIVNNNGVNLTNIQYTALISPTNGVSSATAVDFAVPEATTNITANCAFTSLANFNATNYNKAIRHVVNRSGGNLTLTIAAGWGSDNNRTTTTTYTVTNNTVLNLFWDCQINQFTNAVSYFAF